MSPVHVERWLARAHSTGLGARALVCLLAAAALAPAPASPASPAAPRELPVAPPPLADLDPENDFVVAPPRWIPDCEEQLRRAGVKFTPASMPVRPATSAAP